MATSNPLEFSRTNSQLKNKPRLVILGFSQALEVQKQQVSPAPLVAPIFLWSEHLHTVAQIPAREAQRAQTYLVCTEPRDPTGMWREEAGVQGGGGSVFVISSLGLDLV